MKRVIAVRGIPAAKPQRQNTANCIYLNINSAIATPYKTNLRKKSPKLFLLLPDVIADIKFLSKNVCNTANKKLIIKAIIKSPSSIKT